MSDFRQLHTFKGHVPFGRDLAWSPDGRRLAAPFLDGTIGIWDLEGEDAPSMLLQGPSGIANCVVWSPDGSRLLSGGEKGEVVIWDTESGTTVREMRGDSQEIYAVAWHPTESLVAVGGDESVLMLWDPADGTVHDRIVGSPFQWIYAVEWSPDGTRFAVGSQSDALRVWDGTASRLLWSFDNRSRYVQSLAWSPTGNTLCAGYQEQAVLVFEGDSGDPTLWLEGYSGEVSAVSFSADGRSLASMDEGRNLRLWDTDGWHAGPVVDTNARAPSRDWNGLAFHPHLPMLAVMEEALYVYDAEWEGVFGKTSPSETVRFTSAKIVLVGESNVGKSCLAMRIAEDRYPRDEEQATTHGMRFWPMDAGALDPAAVGSDGHRRDIVLWDFGGQHEYRLVHQLFLHDTALALVLFDPTRGVRALDEVAEWNVRLERQLSDSNAIKLLVGAKQDDRSEIVNRAEVEKVRRACGFDAYIEVSARTGRNLSDLRQALAAAIDWEALATASRPQLFQRVRDYIEARRAAGDVVLLIEDVIVAIQQIDPSADEDSVKSVARQLAVQGTIAQTRLTEGRDALILQVPIIERYAGSLILAARANPRGVPAFEERLLGSTELPLPGIPPGERLPRLDERTLLECVAELMIRHGLCVRHEGLLIFPSLFPPATDDPEVFEHSVSLYYDFTGPIESIYAALVARLMLSGEFGEGRLYRSRAEFDQPDQGMCGIREITRPGGLAHLDLFFSERAGFERRELFSRFVSDHLSRHGVVIRKHQTLLCGGCDREIAEDIVQTNISAGRDDVICPWCRTITSISDAVSTDGSETSQSKRRIVALRAEVERRTLVDSQRAKAAVAGGAAAGTGDDGSIRLLHLSDLHFTAKTSPEAKARWLLQDIHLGEGLGFETVEYLVISGDFTDRGTSEGFEKARKFVTILNGELGISAERCIFVPGNHDVQDLEQAYDWYTSAERAREVEPDESCWRQEGSVVFVPSPKSYAERLRGFSEDFFHKLVQQPYPLDPRKQGLSYFYPGTGIQFLTLDSCWQIDHFHRKRAAIHPDAVANVIKTADEQIKAASEAGSFEPGAPVLRIGVWHHALQHPEMIKDLQFAELLQQAGVQIALHGDVHEVNRDLFRYWHSNALQVVGAGSFDADAKGRPESMPRLYNLLEINRSLGSVRVHTRRQMTSDGPWGPWNEWPIPDGQGARSFYDLGLSAAP